MRKTLTAAIAIFALFLAATVSIAQDKKPASPRGQAATQIGDAWIEVDYGRPILRGRTDIFGSGESYGEKVTARAPLWRAGANQTTRFSTDVALDFGGKKVPAGEYSLYIDLKSPESWTLVLSNWGAQTNYDPDDKENLWGAYGYTADKDVARIPMTVRATELSIDQFTIGFVNVTAEGGTLALGWEHTMALAPFTVVKE